MKDFKLNNVYLATYGYCEPYNDVDYNDKNHDIEKKLKPYIENDCLKTDFDSLSKVAKILSDWNGELVYINEYAMISFFDPNY